MGFTNYLTSFRLHLLKHIRTVFSFSDTRGMTEAEKKEHVAKLLNSAVPIPEETFTWLAQYFRYVEDRDQMLVYDNTTGIWHYEHDNHTFVNMLVDYFTIISEEALATNDHVMLRYANAFFGVGKIPNLAQRMRTAIIFRIRRGADIINSTEHLRYFKTPDGGRALIDLSLDHFNLTPVPFSLTQPKMLMRLSAIPIATDDTPPKLWLSLLDQYMLNKADRLEYLTKVLAYIMSPYNYNQVMIYLLGESGRNGKSTCVKVLQDILGPLAVRMNSELLNSSPSASFKKDDALAATEGKSVLIFNEIDERMVASTQNIKDITEGGRDEFGNKIMTVVRPAYSRNYDVNVCGTPIVIANSLLNFGDWSALDPIFKRIILIPFDYKILHEDPTLLNKLAREYPAIQAWLYRNYFKYKNIALKQEPKPVDIEKKFVQFRIDSDIIGMFWTECIVVTGNNKDEMLRSDLYRMYEQYCKINGRRAIRNKGTNGFQNLIQPYLENTPITRVLRAGSYYIQGIKRSESFDKEVKNL
jgi:hypothetical protein